MKHIPVSHTEKEGLAIPVTFLYSNGMHNYNISCVNKQDLSTLHKVTTVLRTRSGTETTSWARGGGGLQVNESDSSIYKRYLLQP